MQKESGPTTDRIRQMNKFNFSEFSESQIIYKGNRFIAFLIKDQLKSSHQQNRFIVWDRLYDAELSRGIQQFNGKCTGELSFSHVSIEVKPSKSIAEFVRNSAKEQERYFKACGN